jgi:hypothetical protein
MKKYSFMLIVFITIIMGCNKEEFIWNLSRSNPNDGQINDTSGLQVPNKAAPKVTTGSATNISKSTSTVSGDLNSVGSIAASSYGHCWSINPMPTVADAITNLGTTNSTGIFSSNLTGLLSNTTYYVRAYATNSYGTSYGNELSFKTKASSCNYINCESLSGFNTFVDKLSPSYDADWFIGSGYSGKGFALISSNYGGYIEFSTNLSKTSKMTFWTQSINPGDLNRTPEVSIDGILTKTTLIDGSYSYTKWMQLETQNILPGNHTIKINFTRTAIYYQYYIDEIEFWCQ